MPDSKVYKIEELDTSRVVVRWARVVGTVRTRLDYDTLMGLTEEYEKIAHDLSATQVMGSDWLTLIDEMSAAASRFGKEVALAGTDERIMETADVIKLKDSLRFVATVEDVWEL